MYTEYGEEPRSTADKVPAYNWAGESLDNGQQILSGSHGLLQRMPTRALVTGGRQP
jgi:hypothetical protein